MITFKEEDNKPQDEKGIRGRETGMIIIVLTALLLIAVVTMVLTSCTTHEDDSSQAAAPQPIAFSAITNATRTAPGTMTTDGSGTGEESLRTAGFGVFACRTGLHPYISTSQTSNFMWNQQVTYDNTHGLWDYSPVVYWPDPVEGLNPYVTFFAYAPYADHPGQGDTPANTCITDIILPVESGDPWLVYQLGGSTDDWQSHQVDLLYDFQPDQQQGVTSVRVNFGFRHALACAGDAITVTCGTQLQQQLKAAYTDTPVTLTLERITLTYHLLRKGRLSLASTTAPRWQAIASESPTVERRLTLTPAQTIATATSATTCALTDYSIANQGIFYIPIVDAANPQRVDISVDYTTSTGTTRTLQTHIDLNAIATANENRNFRIVL